MTIYSKCANCHEDTIKQCDHEGCFAPLCDKCKGIEKVSGNCIIHTHVAKEDILQFDLHSPPISI